MRGTMSHNFALNLFASSATNESQLCAQFVPISSPGGMRKALVNDDGHRQTMQCSSTEMPMTPQIKWGLLTVTASQRPKSCNAKVKETKMRFVNSHRQSATKVWLTKWGLLTVTANPRPSATHRLLTLRVGEMHEALHHRMNRQIYE